MSTVPKHIVAVGGTFFSLEGEILLVKTDWRGWDLPGGQVEQGEDLVKALIRETREESGCDVCVDKLIGVYSNPRPPEKVMFMFRGRYVSGDPRGDGKETLDAGWFGPNDAIAMFDRERNEANRRKLLDVLGEYDRPVYRAYVTRPFEVIRETKV